MQRTPTGARVADTAEIQRRDSNVAMLMGQSRLASLLYQLQQETLRYIVDQTNRNDADDLSS